MEETFYAGLARRFVGIHDADHAILFLTCECMEQDTPSELLEALALCNMYAALSEDAKGYNGDPWTDLFMGAVELATDYYRCVYPDRPVPTWHG